MADETTKKVRRAALDMDAGAVNVYGPPDDSGKQHVVAMVSLRIGELPTAMLHKAAAQGVFDIAGNGFYRKDDLSSDDVVTIINRTVNAFLDGSWTPGRTFTGETPDIILALAEVLGVPVHVVEKDVEERLVLDEHGNPVKDKRGRNKRVFTAAALDALANTPEVKPIMARLAKERAERLAREAKAERGKPTTGALDLFANLRPQAAAEAAE